MPSRATTETAPPDAPEVLRRLLALIDTLHQPQDLTVERVEQFSGVAMTPFSDKPSDDAYQIFQRVTEMWFYLYIWDLERATHSPDLGLLFVEAEKYSGKNPPMTGICQLDLAQFHDALLKMDYRHVGNTRQRSAGKQYQRGLVKIDVGIVGESGESIEKISHRCVNRVFINFLGEYMDLGAM